MMRDFIRTSSKYVLISIGLFIISLSQKCYCTPSHCSYSIMAFLLGLAGMASSAAAFSWLANPLLIISWILQKRNPRGSMLLTMFAFLFTLSFLLFDSVLANENGQQQAITSYKPGYWFWVCSAGIMMLGGFVQVYRLNIEQQRSRVRAAGDSNR